MGARLLNGTWWFSLFDCEADMTMMKQGETKKSFGEEARMTGGTRALVRRRGSVWLSIRGGGKLTRASIEYAYAFHTSLLTSYFWVQVLRVTVKGLCWGFGIEALTSKSHWTIS